MQVIPKNVAEFVSVPKQKKAKNDYYTEEEAQNLIEKSKGSDIYLEILLAVGMGLRRGEVLLFILFVGFLLLRRRNVVVQPFFYDILIPFI